MQKKPLTSVSAKSTFEKEFSDARATYSLKDNGDINVLNECIKDGKLSGANGVAYATDASNSKLKVSFFRPFYGNFPSLDMGKTSLFGQSKTQSCKYIN